MAAMVANMWTTGYTRETSFRGKESQRRSDESWTLLNTFSLMKVKTGRGSIGCIGRDSNLLRVHYKKATAALVLLLLLLMLLAACFLLRRIMNVTPMDAFISVGGGSQTGIWPCIPFGTSLLCCTTQNSSIPPPPPPAAITSPDGRIYSGPRRRRTYSKWAGVGRRNRICSHGASPLRRFCAESCVALTMSSIWDQLRWRQILNERVEPERRSRVCRSRHGLLLLLLLSLCVVFLLACCLDKGCNVCLAHVRERETNCSFEIKKCIFHRMKTPCQWYAHYCVSIFSRTIFKDLALLFFSSFR